MARYQIKKRKPGQVKTKEKPQSKKKPQSVKKPAKKPIQDLSKNPPVRRPHPMIQPLVDTAPPQKLRSQAAHTAGFTPEAYKDLRQVPVSVGPAYDDETPLGFYGDDPPGIYVRGFDEGQPRPDPTHLAHEQAHAWWYNRGMEQPDRKRQFMNDFGAWESIPGAGADARENWRQTAPRYDEAAMVEPTELYARTVQLSGPDRSDWPGIMRPYYKGLLQGMETGEEDYPTPDLNLYPGRNDVRPWSLDYSEDEVGIPRTWDKRGW